MQRPLPRGVSFPVLTLKEVYSGCLGAGCTISHDDLTHPTPARIQVLYEWWLTAILKITIDDCKRAADDRLDQMENPEIHRDAMYIGVFQLALDQLLRAAAMDDFSVSDLLAPTSQRVVLILSCLINYKLFEHEQYEKYFAPLQAEDDALEARERALLERNEDLAARIAQEKDRRLLNAPKAEQCRQRIVDLRSEFDTLREQSRVAEKQAKEASDELKHLVSDINEIRKTISSYELDISRLKRQIVQSPDRLRASVAEMARSLQQDKDSVVELEVKERQLQAKITSLQKYEIDLGSCLKIMDEWEVDAKKLNDAIARFQDHCELHDSLLAEQAELENKISLLKRRVNNSRDELSRFEEKTERKRAANKQRKKALEEQHAHLVEQKRMLDLAAASKNREAAEVENQIREIHAALHKEIDRGSLEYKAIRNQFYLYSNRLNKALDAINALNMQELDL